MTTTYLSRDPRKKIPFFTNGEDVYYASIGAFFASCIVFLPLLAVLPWLGLGAPVSFVSFVTWAIYRLRSGKKNLIKVTSGVAPHIRKFRDNWFRLDDQLQLELADIYHSVVRIVDGIHQTESAHVRYRLNQEIDSRSRIVEKVADEAELARSMAIHDSVVTFDDHALETARLYIESFQQQREEKP